MSSQTPSDEVETVVSEVKGGQKAQYLKRQKDSFNAVGGGPEGWRPAPLVEIEHRYSKDDTLRVGKPQIIYHFDIPAGYTEVYGFNLTYVAQHNADPDNKDDQISISSVRGFGVCQLCGWAPLVHQWPILNDKRALVMNVGSECVDNFMGAGYLTKQVTLFKETKLREAYAKWLGSVFKEIDTKGEPRNYGDGLWLPRPIWLLKRKLEKSKDAKRLTSRKIANLFKAAYKVKLSVPGEVGPLLGLPLSMGAKMVSEASQVQKPRQILKYDTGKTFLKVGETWVEAHKVGDSYVPLEGAIPVVYQPVKSTSHMETPTPPMAKQRLRIEGSKVSVWLEGYWLEAHKEGNMWVPNTEATPVADFDKVDFSAITIGVYKIPNGDIYVVRPNKDRSRNYAMKLTTVDGSRLTESGAMVSFDFKYQAGAMKLLRPEYRMGEEEAKALSIRYGRCIVCGRKLIDSKSVERGIGPVCIKTIRGQKLSKSEEEADDIPYGMKDGEGV